MPITVDTDELNPLRTNAGQTDTNEVLYKLNPAFRYFIEAVVTSAGTASMKVETDTVAPTDFSGMSIAQDGTQSVNFIRSVEGCSYAGLDIASGTWTVRVRRV